MTAPDPPALVDVLLEVFTWIGFAGALALGVVAVILWAADGTWLPATAYVDREGEETIVRWYDADGDANSAVAKDADAEALAGADTTDIWYRHGWRGRMRLTRRPPGLRTVAWSAAGLLALGVIALVGGWVVYFTRG